ncbi:MAG: hypothetical protein JWM87_4718, partial [Candidatus Eremiobacteraeota bacterium]|nr:hypothetical protein [Candidatus Eremiobacteraeota bacterium]
REPGVIANALGALAGGALGGLAGRRADENVPQPESRRPLRTPDAVTAPRPR